MSDLIISDPFLCEETSQQVQNHTDDDTIEGDIEIDLHSYISNYHGYMYYFRLFFIAQRCPSLRGLALRLAHDYIKKSTLDTTSYNKIFLMLAEAETSNVSSSSMGSGEAVAEHRDVRPPPNGQPADTINLSSPDEVNALGSTLSDAAKMALANVINGKNEANLIYDAHWEESTRRKGLIRLEQLDTDLKNFMANSIKESIRRGSDDLGDLYLQLGQLNNASKCYSRSRDYCTSQQQELAMCLNVIKVAIFQRAWPHVSAHVTRAGSLSELRDSSLPLTSTAATANNRIQTRLGTSGRSTGLRAVGNTNSATSNRSADGVGGRPGSTMDSVGSRAFPRVPNDVGTTQTPGSRGQSYRDAMGQARTQLAIAAGLVELAARNYRGAASNFLQVNYDHCESPKSSIVTPSDLAFFITLCSLATYERSELASLVLGSPNLRLLLEAEPACRDMLQSFHQADYAACLNRLNKLSNLLRLDIFLSDHVTTLCREIRCRALCQYFSPYSSADLNLMARAFDTTVANLENELALLIQEGSIKGRIDSHKQLLRVLDVDQRCLTFARAMRLADEYKKRMQTMILRMSLTRQKLTIQSSRDESEAVLYYLS